MDFYKKFREQDVLTEIPAGKVVVAVSGGADSVCLLHAVRRLHKEKRWELIVMHVQHHLRGKASMEDQEFVEGLARAWGLKFETREIYPPKDKKTEEMSRILRYHQLGEAAIKFEAQAVLTAHNANDQMETFFLNLLRGSGPDGLAGMPPVRPLSEITGEPKHGKIKLVRPLLEFSRSEILKYLKSQKLAFHTDQSNLDLKYRRNWIRHRVIPLLESAQPKLAERIASLAKLLREQKEFMDAQVSAMEKNVVGWGGKPPGCRLDLTRFFEYNEHLRQYFLHRLRPRDSYQEIGEMAAFLKRRQKAETIPLPL